MKYGYSRISTNDGRQNVEKWTTVLLDAGVESADHIVYEAISGRTSWQKRKLGTLVNSLHAGDEIVTPELSRLGRSSRDVLELRDALSEKGITVKTLREGYRIGMNMRPADKMVITVMAAAAEMERDYLSERIKEGLAHARSEGRVGGRPLGSPKYGGRKMDRSLRHRALQMLQKGGTVSGTAKVLGISRQTIYNWRSNNRSLEK